MLFAFTAFGQGGPMESKLVAGDEWPLDQFGCAVDIEGEYAIVGSRLDDEAGNNSGSAYVFQRDSITGDWTQYQKLTPSDGIPEARFGRAVAINGDYILVGAHMYDSIGVAYVFFRNGDFWSEQAKLEPSDGDFLDFFGIDVGISGEFAIIGALGDDEGGDSVGAAYIFQRTDTVWTQHTKLIPADGTIDDRFGRSVAIDGAWAIVGSHGDDDNGSASGAAYVYGYNGASWTERAKLGADDATASDNFGYSVDIAGNDVIVGAHAAEADESGAAYIFRRNIFWNQIAKLLPNDPAPLDEFGTSVGIAGGVAVVGAAHKADSAGAAYVYQENVGVWELKNKLVSSEAEAGDEFGREVAISNLDALIGALGADGNVVSNSGAAFAYRDITLDVPQAPAGQTLPVSMNLHQNYPNPFNPTTAITYDLVNGANVELTIHNLIGQQVRSLVNEYQSSGTYSATWDGKNEAGKEVAGGIYLYKLKAGAQVFTKKMVFLK
jgi:hypothetical protein